MAYLTSDLLTGVRRAGMFPSSGTNGTSDADILAQADKEISTSLLPLLMSIREEWCVKVQDVAMVVGQSEYRLPTRSVGSRLRGVQSVNAQGLVINLERVEPRRTQEVLQPGTGYPWAYYLQGAGLVLLPTPSQALTLRMRYFQRPGRLVATSTCALLTSATSGSTWALGSSTDLGAGTYDLVSGSSPFETLAVGAVTRAGVGTYSVPAASLPGYGCAVGDWVCQQDTSCVVPLPVELHGVLEQRTASRVLLALGYQSEAAQTDADSKEMLTTALKLLTPRTEGEARKVVGGMAWRNRYRTFGRGW